MEISGYKDLEEIGRGGYAVVYRAHQAQFGRQVAIKVLTNPGFGPTDRARFEREALAMGRLSWHPNIVVVHETGTTETGLPYLVEEFLEGGSLGEKLRRDGPMGPPEALADIIQLCAAVHTAHEADLLHRDIKPDNALIDTFGRIKLADFGIAAVTGSTLTATGMVTATIAHAAPEVLTGERATFQADVYSLGSTLYELLTGEAAFVRNTDESIVPLVLRVTSDPVPDLRARGVPAVVADAVEGAMAKDPADRPPTALAFGQMLQEAQQALGLKVTDLAVRAGVAPAPRHDETIMGAVPTPPVAPAVAAAAAAAATQAPTPTPTPEPAAPSGPPPAEPAVAQETAREVAAAEMAAPTGTVAVPLSTPAPGQAARVAEGPGGKGTGAKPPGDKKRSPVPYVLVLLVLLAGVAAFVLLSGGDDGGTDNNASEDFSADSSGESDSNGDTNGGNAGANVEEHGEDALAAVIETGPFPFRVATTDDAIWVTTSDSTTVDRIDPATNEVVETIDIGGEPSGIDANSSGVWVSNYTDGTVVHIDADTNQVTEAIDVGDGPRNVSATETAVWVANIDSNTVSRIDVAARAVQANIDVGAAPRGIAATDTEVWVSNSEGGSVTRIDPATNQVVATVDTGGTPGGVEIADFVVWVTNSDDETVIQIDSGNNTVLGTIQVGVDPGGTAATATEVYVANSFDSTVYVIDADSGEVVETYETGEKPAGLAITGTDLWVANAEADSVSRIPLD